MKKPLLENSVEPEMSQPNLEGDESDLIVVRERGSGRKGQTSRYHWPHGIDKVAHGYRRSKASTIFNIVLRFVALAKPKYRWIPLFRNATGKNSIADFPELLEVLNTIFRDQLESNYSESQKALLIEADVVLICYDPIQDSILSYGSCRFSPKGSIGEVKHQVIHFGHMIVARGYEKNQLTPLSGVAMGVYGQSFVDLFRKEIVVIRTNNKYVERIFDKAPPVYRSDKLCEVESNEGKAEVVKAIRWTDEHVFHAEQNFEFGSPTKVSHRFSSNITIDGVGTDEIIYLAGISSVGLYVLRIMKSGLDTRGGR